MPETNLNDAINFINNRDAMEMVKEVESFFAVRLKEKEGQPEQELESMFYLLRIKLKKHSYFETKDSENLRNKFIQKAREMEIHHIKNFEASTKGMIEKTELNAFYHIMEYYFSALEEDYENLHFHKPRELCIEEKLQYRQNAYFYNKEWKLWFAYYMYGITSLYGNSMYRWFLTSIFTIIVFCIIFAFIDSISPADQLFIDINNGGHWYDYFYFGIVTFTTLGYGDITPHTLLQKLFVSIEILVGYFMFGMLMNLLSKKLQ